MFLVAMLGVGVEWICVFESLLPYLPIYLAKKVPISGARAVRRNFLLFPSKSTFNQSIAISRKWYVMLHGSLLLKYVTKT